MLPPTITTKNLLTQRSLIFILVWVHLWDSMGQDKFDKYVSGSYPKTQLKLYFSGLMIFNAHITKSQGQITTSQGLIKTLKIIWSNYTIFGILQLGFAKGTRIWINCCLRIKKKKYLLHHSFTHRRGKNRSSSQDAHGPVKYLYFSLILSSTALPILLIDLTCLATLVLCLWICSTAWIWLQKEVKGTL